MCLLSWYLYSIIQEKASYQIIDNRFLVIEKAEVMSKDRFTLKKLS